MLTGIEVAIGAFSPSTPLPGVSVRLDDAGKPGTLLYRLKNPATFTANATNTFTAPEDAPLERGVTYWVVFEEVGRLTGEHYQIKYTSGGGEDSGAATGWSIGDGAAERAEAAIPPSWTTSSGATPKIAVTGYDIPNTTLLSNLGKIDANAKPTTRWTSASTSSTTTLSISASIPIRSTGAWI